MKQLFQNYAAMKKDHKKFGKRIGREKLTKHDSQLPALKDHINKALESIFIEKISEYNVSTSSGCCCRVKSVVHHMHYNYVSTICKGCRCI